MIKKHIDLPPTMGLMRGAVILGTAFSLACAAPAVQPTAGPVPKASEAGTSSSSSEPSKTSGESWTFAYAPGRYTYDFQIEAEVARFPDTSTFRAIPSVTQTVTIERNDTGTTVIDPPAPSSFKCDPAAALHSRATTLLAPIPSAQLTAGGTWKDSTTVNGCRGTIPTTTTTVRTFTVVGDTTYNDQSVLLIKRRDTIVAKGEGNEGAHRILLSAQGNALTNMFFDPKAGRFVGADGVQTTQVDITTSGRTSQFLQRIKEHIRLNTL